MSTVYVSPYWAGSRARSAIAFGVGFCVFVSGTVMVLVAVAKGHDCWRQGQQCHDSGPSILHGSSAPCSNYNQKKCEDTGETNMRLFIAGLVLAGVAFVGLVIFMIVDRCQRRASYAGGVYTRTIVDGMPLSTMPATATKEGGEKTAVVAEATDTVVMMAGQPPSHVSEPYHVHVACDSVVPIRPHAALHHHHHAAHMAALHHHHHHLDHLHVGGHHHHHIGGHHHHHHQGFMGAGGHHHHHGHC